MFMNTGAINRYFRDDAVRYALKYALTPNYLYRYLPSHGEGGGDCSNFISQCLMAGGAHMDHSPPRPWWYNNNGTQDTRNDTWSVSWSVAHSLYWCLKARYNLNLPGLKGMEVYDLGLLEHGDIIQYENNGGVIYHSAIITDFTYQGGRKAPLISQHSFDALNISCIKPAAKKMHFIKIIV
jgi:cell wall-associated NlpC family hydrolase